MPRPVPYEIHGHLVAKAIEVSNDDPSIAIQAMCFAIVHMALIVLRSPWPPLTKTISPIVAEQLARCECPFCEGRP